MSEPIFKINIVEDDEWYRKFLVHNISLNPDFDITAYSDGKTFLDQLEKKPHVVTLDYRLPDISGKDLLKKIKEFDPTIEVIIISEQDDIETAIELLRLGAYDYITKTKDIRDRLLNIIQHIKNNTSLQSRIESLQTEVEKKYDFQKTIIGQSNPIKQVFRMMEKATTNNITVVVQGETGTGKEMVAKAIHYNSPRKKAPFIAVNMSAIPHDLAESELFGHEKGSFTGAANRHIGKFEQAKGGTLFLDEVGEMELTLQAKLLRALQEKEITRVGGSETIKTDCRIIAATNKNLLDEMKKGNFREDLYYRLFGLPIELPPLRDRDKDAAILAKYFVSNFCKENDMEEKSLSKEALQKLLGYPFPGNIRELKAVVELAVVMSDKELIEVDDITFAQPDPVTEVYSEELTMREYEYKIIKMYLKNNNDDIKTVAKKLDIGQSTIYRILKEVKENK
ncbi:MAG: sigma-54 dependent transcriptional regulator [Cyclobacteriaceae bacterium]